MTKTQTPHHTPARTYGLIIDVVGEYGTEYVTARILAREDQAAHPINPDSERESSLRGAPKHAVGLRYDGLGLRGFCSYYPARDGGVELLGFGCPEYRDAYRVGIDDAKSILKTLTKVEKTFSRLVIHTPASALEALYVALDLDWVVVKTGGWGTSYSTQTWRWTNLEEGQRILADLIANLTPPRR